MEESKQWELYKNSKKKEISNDWTEELREIENEEIKKMNSHN